MFKNECSLCGGKLDSNKICRECGLNNSKTDANYVINRSSCDKKPLTHVHEETKPSRHEKKVQDNRKKNQPTNQKTYQNTYSANKHMRQEKPKNGKRFIGKTAVIVVIISILGELVSIIPGILYDMGGSGFSEITEVFQGEAIPEPGYGYDYDPYEYVTREIPVEGEEYSTTLGQGEYVVGVHIPEGIYTCTVNVNYASIDVEDNENSIWLYEWMDEDTPEVSDIRLYSGAVLEVTGDGILEVSTSNAQMGGMVFTPNPLETGTLLINNNYSAGTEFEAGVYDICAEEGYGSIKVTVYNDADEILEEKYIWLDADFEVESTYKNLVLPENAVLTWEEYDELKVSLTPSLQVKDTDYLGYYEYY